MSVNPLVTSIQSPQHFYEIHPSERFNGLSRVLDQYIGGVSIIFCRTKKDVDHISEKLSLLNYNVSSYHGDLSPTAREKALDLFVKQKNNILVLTDIPNQLDNFPNINLVLFSIIPQDPDSYIQRILRLEATLAIDEVATLITTNEFKKIAFIKRVTKSNITQKQFLDVAEIIKLKQENLDKRLKSFDLNEVEDSIRIFSKNLLNEHDPEALVSYLLKHGFYGDFSEDHYDVLKTNSGSNTKPTNSNAPQLTDVDAGSERLFIAIGKTDDVDEEKLKQFLFIETNIEKNNFSDIKIFETFSFFVVSHENADIILEMFRRKKRGKRSIVERAKGKDSKKKH